MPTVASGTRYGSNIERRGRCRLHCEHSLPIVKLLEGSLAESGLTPIWFCKPNSFVDVPQGQGRLAISPFFDVERNLTKCISGSMPFAPVSNVLDFQDGLSRVRLLQTRGETRQRHMTLSLTMVKNLSRSGGHVRIIFACLVGTLWLCTGFGPLSYEVVLWALSLGVFGALRFLFGLFSNNSHKHNLLRAERENTVVLGVGYCSVTKSGWEARTHPLEEKALAFCFGHTARTGCHERAECVVQSVPTRDGTPHQCCGDCGNSWRHQFTASLQGVEAMELWQVRTAAGARRK